MKQIKETLGLVTALNKHLIVKGDSGIGKTTSILRVCREECDNVYEYGGHKRSESIDLTGNTIRFGETMVFVDGYLTQAFVKAQTEKVIFYVDEIGRIPDAEKDLLIMSLTPNDKNLYKLDTGRAVEKDGRFIMETILVPSENLTVVATTNDGDNFAVSLGDDAFKERFISINASSDVYDDISKMFKSDDEDKITEFDMILDKFKDLANRGVLKRNMNFRFAENLVFCINDTKFSSGIKANVISDDFYEKYVDEVSSESKNLLTSMVSLIDDKIETSTSSAPEYTELEQKDINDIIERMASRTESK